MSIAITGADLDEHDLELISDLLNDYLEEYDPEEEYFHGVDDSAARHAKVELLYGRLIGVDFSGETMPEHHIDCVCEWCELGRVN